ncbi:MAG: hypothetical protein ACR652_21770 [Methylocystis sp.]
MSCRVANGQEERMRFMNHPTLMAIAVWVATTGAAHAGKIIGNG